MLKSQAVKTFVFLFILLLLAGCQPPQAGQPTSTSTSAPLPVSTFTPTAKAVVNQVYYERNIPNNGLSLKTGGDFDIEIVQLPDVNRTAVRSGNGAALSSGNGDPDYYIQFEVDDDFLYAGSPTSRVVILIEYLDDGLDTFNIQYDALSGGPFGNGKFKDTRTVHKTGSGEIKTVEIPLCDANFANRDGNADFRIGDAGDGAETILRVTVRKAADTAGPVEINVDACGANPFDDQPDSDAIQS